jgi:uncharacterized integral membrane protein
MKPIEIHQTLSEKCNDGVMDMKKVRLWVQRSNKSRVSCESNPQEPRARICRSEDMIAGMEQMAMFWDSEGVTHTHCVPKGTTVTGETYEVVLRKPFLPVLREKRSKRMQLSFFIAKILLLIGLLVFTSFSNKTTLKFFLMLRTHLNSHH